MAGHNDRNLPDIPEQFAPNADMSLREQFGQYAYGRTVAEVMTNPERDISEITNAAARAGMDIVFGESHDVIDQTMQQITNIVNSTPADQINGIVLELPMQLQELFQLSTLQSMSREEFFVEFTALEIEGVIATIENMLEDGAITQDQYDQLQSGFVESMQNFLVDMREAESIYEFLPRDVVEGSIMFPVYDMALNALEKGVPVIAGDEGREREVGFLMRSPFIMDTPISREDFDVLMAEGMDDRSDVEILADQGVDISQSGILIVHRGYDHINGRVFEGAEPTDGFDDVLEENGRNVVTFAMLSDGLGYDLTLEEITDPADFTAIVDSENEVSLERDAYIAKDAAEPNANEGEAQPDIAPSTPLGPSMP